MPRPHALSRLPVRIRVTLAFTMVMAILLTGAGLFVYYRLENTLGDTVDRGLRSRADDVSALVGEADSGLEESGRSPLTERGENAAQVLDRDGRVVDATVSARSESFLTREQLVRAYRHTIYVESEMPGEGGGTVRVLARPVEAHDRRLVVVVASSLGPTEEALRDLRRQLVVGGPIVLLIAAIAGYFAAAGALRPVESMRRRAREIGGQHRVGQRLPVPPSGDEVARLGETLNEMLDRLEQSFDRERAFVSDASHELRMPLAILKGELELAMRHATTVEEFRDAISSASEETDRVVQLAEDLLVIARSDQGQLPVRTERVDVGELLASTAQRFALRAREHDIALTCEAPEGLVVELDSLRIEQALGNLVENGLRHGGGPVQLTAEADGASGCRITVSDSGGGFAPDFLPHALERFSRGDAARSRGGTGLGLAIVEAIVSAHGGSVTVSNGADGGARIQVVIPGTAAPA